MKVKEIFTLGWDGYNGDRHDHKERHDDRRRDSWDWGNHRHERHRYWDRKNNYWRWD